MLAPLSNRLFALTVIYVVAIQEEFSSGCEDKLKGETANAYLHWSIQMDAAGNRKREG